MKLLILKHYVEVEIKGTQILELIFFSEYIEMKFWLKLATTISHFFNVRTVKIVIYSVRVYI